MTEDLSRRHGPSTNLFPAPESAEGWDACRLSDGQVAATGVNVFRDGVRPNSDEPPLEGVPAVPRGEPMGGRFFPLLCGGGRQGIEG